MLTCTWFHAVPPLKNAQYEVNPTSDQPLVLLASETHEAVARPKKSKNNSILFLLRSDMRAASAKLVAAVDISPSKSSALPFRNLVDLHFRIQKASHLDLICHFTAFVESQRENDGE